MIEPMANADDLIKPDPRSKYLTPEWMEHQFAEVPLSEYVPEDIKDLVKLAKDVARYGYFQYAFYQLSWFLLILSFEGALREKYNKSKQSFLKLINKAKKEFLIPSEIFSDVMLSRIYELRNIYAHPLHRPLKVFSAKGFQNMVHLVNCIFDENARINPPCVIANELESRRKFKLLMETGLRIKESKLIPGDLIVTVGLDETFDPGIYECLICGEKWETKGEANKLIACEKCKGIDFRLLVPGDSKEGN